MGLLNALPVRPSERALATSSEYELLTVGWVVITSGSGLGMYWHWSKCRVAVEVGHGQVSTYSSYFGSRLLYHSSSSPQGRAPVVYPGEAISLELGSPSIVLPNLVGILEIWMRVAQHLNLFSRAQALHRPQDLLSPFWVCFASIQPLQESQVCGNNHDGDNHQ